MARLHTFEEYPHVSTYKDRKGEIRYRFRHKLIKEVTMRAEFDTPEFAAEHKALMARVHKEAAAKSFVSPTAPLPKKMNHILEKTFRHAWVLLQGSLDWDGLKVATRDSLQTHIEEFLQGRVLDDSDEVFADAPLGGIKAAHLQAHYNATYRQFPSKGKKRIEAIRKLYDVAIEATWIEAEENKTKFLKTRALPESDANRPWTDEERQQYEAKWKLGTPQRTAYELGICLGSRRGDLAKIGPADVKNQAEYAADGSLLRQFQAIEWKAQKGRKGKKQNVVYHEITDRLAKALAALTHDMNPAKPFLRKELGSDKGYSDKSLSRRMRIWTNQAGLPEGLTLHGLRHTLGSDIILQTGDTKKAQLSLGHQSEITTIRYTRRVNREQVMKGVAEVMNGNRTGTVIKTVAALKMVKG
jgi:integrase